MLKRLLLSFLCGSLLLPLSAQPGMSVYLDYCLFTSPANGPYLEVYVGIDLRTITMVPVSEGWRGEVELLLLLKDGDGKIVNFDKVISAPLATDSVAMTNSLLLQRRLAISEGAFALEAIVTDGTDSTNVWQSPLQPIEVDFSAETVNFSGIHFVQEATPTSEEDLFVRNGLFMPPYLLPYYPTQQDALVFYAEVYGLDEGYLDEDILITYAAHVRNDVQAIPNMLVFQKVKGKAVLPVVGGLNLANLPSGEYELHLTVRDRQNNEIARTKTVFYRSNKKGIEQLSNLTLLDVGNTFVAEYTDEQVAYFIKSLRPIGTAQEVNAIASLTAQEDASLNRQFFYNFWVNRNLTKPEESWAKYLTLVRYTEANYATNNRHGFETDRGRVYLEYGPPNEMDIAGFESSTKPYEIWTYNVINRGESNVVFVFLNEDMITNEFRLIHSTATGEISNDRWQQMLYNTFTPGLDMDDNGTRDHFGTKVSDQYNFNQRRDR